MGGHFTILCPRNKATERKMSGFYIILAGLVLIALFGIIVAYREDHADKTSPKPWKYS
jgi:hypothetical protein